MACRGTTLYLYCAFVVQDHKLLPCPDARSVHLSRRNASLLPKIRSLYCYWYYFSRILLLFLLLWVVVFFFLTYLLANLVLAFLLIGILRLPNVPLLIMQWRRTLFGKLIVSRRKRIRASYWTEHLLPHSWLCIFDFVARAGSDFRGRAINFWPL
jgi:hypothetical protein